MTRVLVVDDEEEIVSMLTRTLEREGFDVEGASQREVAVEKMENKLFPIVVLDVKFPETSGQELLREFKRINPLANVVMITGYSSIKNVIECLGGGAVDYFTKPLDMDVFLETLESLDDRVDRWEETVKLR